MMVTTTVYTQIHSIVLRGNQILQLICVHTRLTMVNFLLCVVHTHSLSNRMCPQRCVHDTCTRKRTRTRTLHTPLIMMVLS